MPVLYQAGCVNEAVNGMCSPVYCQHLYNIHVHRLGGALLSIYYNRQERVCFVYVYVCEGLQGSCGMQIVYTRDRNGGEEGISMIACH